MGLFNWIQSKVLGVDLAAEQARQDQSDSQLAELNNQALSSGRYDQKTFEVAEANRIGSQLNVQGEVNQAFKEGAQEGFDSVTGGIKSGLNFPLKFLWAAVPWWIWAGAVLALLHYFGLLRPLIRRVAK